MSSVTKLIRTEERDGTHWRLGNVGARRDENGVHLTVSGSKQRTVESPAMSNAHAQWAADALRAASVNAGSQACAGKSILETLWEELDTIVDRILSGTPAKDGRDPGRAEGVAYCIAVFQNPYMPNLESVREEATERWYEENPEEA